MAGKNEVRVTIVGEDKLSPAVKSADSTLSGFAGNVKGRLSGTLDDLGKRFPVVGKAANFMGMDIASVAGPVGAVAGAAVGAGAVLKGLGDQFANTALDAKKMADATGLSVESASEWTAAADDVGISADTLAGAFGKATKALGSTPQKFAELGVEIVKTNTGAVDMNGTLLSAIDTIQATADPTKKAALASQLFGKSWAELTPLLDKGAAQLRETMAATSDAQRITDGEVKSAQAWQSAMDNLGDVAVDLKLSLGQLVVEGFVPLIEKIAEAGNDFAWFVDQTGAMTGGLTDIGEAAAFAFENISPPGQVFRALGLARTGVEELGSAWDAMTDSGEPAVTAIKDIGDATTGYARNLQTATSRVEDHKAAQETAQKALEAAKAATKEYADMVKHAADRLDEEKRALDEARAALEAKQQAALGALSSELGYENAVDGVGDSLADYQAASVAAAQATKDHGAASAEATTAEQAQDQASRDLKGSILEAAGAAAQAAQDQAEASGKTFTTNDSINAQVTALQALKLKFPELSAGIDEYINKLNGIPRTITTTVILNDAALGGQVVTQSGHGGNADAKAKASGGYASGLTELAEAGREFVRLPDGSMALVEQHSLKDLPPGSFVVNNPATEKMLGLNGPIMGPVMPGAGAGRNPGIRGPVSGGSPADRNPAPKPPQNITGPEGIGVGMPPAKPPISDDGPMKAPDWHVTDPTQTAGWSIEDWIRYAQLDNAEKQLTDQADIVGRHMPYITGMPTGGASRPPNEWGVDPRLLTGPPRPGTSPAVREPAVTVHFHVAGSIIGTSKQDLGRWMSEAIHTYVKNGGAKAF